MYGNWDFKGFFGILFLKSVRDFFTPRQNIIFQGFRVPLFSYILVLLSVPETYSSFHRPLVVCNMLTQHLHTILVLSQLFFVYSSFTEKYFHVTSVHCIDVSCEIWQKGSITNEETGSDFFEQFSFNFIDISKALLP